MSWLKYYPFLPQLFISYKRWNLTYNNWGIDKTTLSFNIALVVSSELQSSHTHTHIYIGNICMYSKTVQTLKLFTFYPYFQNFPPLFRGKATL